MPDAPEVPSAPVAEDPLAADRRTLTIGAIAVVVLVLIGVVSAQLFARGGCTSVPEPRPWSDGGVGTGDLVPEERIEAVISGVDGARAVDLIERAVGTPVVATIPVDEAAGVTAIDGGLVTTGPTVTSVDADLSPVATYTTDHQVVGDGDTVYDVTVPNAATGQTDAFVALSGTDLEVGACVDTAVVGSPFAFLLDAEAGELLLFRAEEDGDAPELQLRQGEDGTLWETRVTQPAGPPGSIAERLTARLGPDAVVAARRVGPQEDTEAAAVVALSRDDGEVLFELDGDALAEAAELDASGPIRWEVAAVGAQTALVHGRPDPSDAATAEEGQAPASDGSLVVLDLADGAVLGTATGLAPVTTAAADPGTSEDRYAVATAGDADGDQLGFVAADGSATWLDERVGEPQFAWLDDRLLVAGRDSLSVLEPDASTPTVSPLPGARFADVTLTDDGRVATLLTPRDGGDAILLVTAPADGAVTDG